MRYIVYGAGAIGGVIGARLFQQGLEVVLIARGDHLSAIRRTGLTIQSPVGSVTLQVPVLGYPSEVAFWGAEDVVLLTTKTQDNPQALGDLRYAAGTQTPVVCLQNGVEGGRIALRLFERVYGAMVMLPATHLKPGIVQQFSSPVPGVVDVGRYPTGEDPLISSVCADLRRAGFHSEVRPDILRWQYGKLLENLQNALQALCGPDADYADLLAELRTEAESCYRAAEIQWASASELRTRTRGLLSLGKIDGQPRTGGSSWQSLARSAGSIETDFLNGEIALLGRLHGVRTPLNAMIQDVAERVAGEHRPPGSIRADDLRKSLRSSSSP